MEVDHVVVVRSNLSSKACQPKDVSTNDDLPVESGTSVQTSNPTKVVSCVPHVSAENNVGHFKNMRRECQIKSFGLGPFSYVCRMIRFSEPNTSEVEPLEDDLQVESPGFSSEASFKPSFEECCVENDNQHYVFGVVEPEHILDFQLRLSWIRKRKTMLQGKAQAFLAKEMKTLLEKKMSMMGVMSPQHPLSLMNPTGNSRLKDRGTSRSKRWCLV